jgi:carbon storage regulator
MLVLTRRVDERIMIGEDIYIQIVSISGDSVRLGISAPEGLKILREEIYTAVKKENLAASQAPSVASIDSIAQLAGKLRRDR